MSITSEKKFLKNVVMLRVAAASCIALLLASAGAYAYLDVGPDRIARGVSVGEIKLGGSSADEAAKALRDRFAGLQLTYLLPGAEVGIVPAKTGAVGKGGIAEVDVDGSVANALRIGKGGTPRAAFELARTAVFGKDGDDFLRYGMDENALREAIEAGIEGKVSEVADAQLVVRVANGTGTPSVSVIKERDGLMIDYAQAARMTVHRIVALDDEPIELSTRKARAQVTETNVEPLKTGIAPALARAPLSLTVKGKTWAVSKSLLADWIAALPTDSGVRLGLDAEKVSKYLESRTADLTTDPVEAIFEMKDGKVTKFVPSKDGEKLDTEASLARIEQAVFGETAAEGQVELVMAVAAPDTETGESNELGIKETIGVGSTNFSGSPKNRRHNIAVGAAAVNGSLVPPGEEFSLLKTLGTIDGSTGYLQELVIKENKTIPEYGGGLCQIGSTTFRAVLGSGLPVTARQNHSYRVPYYERAGDGSYIGPGKDATIYNPAPDFRFKNDTEHHVLITTEIAGNTLTFSFWGTKDGRVAEQTDARVYNVVPPPKKKVIETTELPPGKEKCTESAHVGSDAIFTYTVTMADGEKRVVDFKSRYRPWQEVCLLGIDPALLPIASEGPTIPSIDTAGAPGI